MNEFTVLSNAFIPYLSIWYGWARDEWIDLFFSSVSLYSCENFNKDVTTVDQIKALESKTDEVL